MTPKQTPTVGAFGSRLTTVLSSKNARRPRGMLRSSKSRRMVLRSVSAWDSAPSAKSAISYELIGPPAFWVNQQRPPCWFIARSHCTCNRGASALHADHPVQRSRIVPMVGKRRYRKPTQCQWEEIWPGPAMKLVGPLAARSPGLRLALALEIERHCRKWKWKWEMGREMGRKWEMG